MWGRLVRQMFAGFWQPRLSKDKGGGRLVEFPDKDSSRRTNKYCAKGWKKWMDQVIRFYISTNQIYSKDFGYFGWALVAYNCFKLDTKQNCMICFFNLKRYISLTSLLKHNPLSKKPDSIAWLAYQWVRSGF